MGRGLDERPAHVFGAIPGERPPVVSTSGLAEDRAQLGVWRPRRPTAAAGAAVWRHTRQGHWALQHSGRRSSRGALPPALPRIPILVSAGSGSGLHVARVHLELRHRCGASRSQAERHGRRIQLPRRQPARYM